MVHGVRAIAGDASKVRTVGATMIRGMRRRAIDAGVGWLRRLREAIVKLWLSGLTILLVGVLLGGEQVLRVGVGLLLLGEGGVNEGGVDAIVCELVRMLLRDVLRNVLRKMRDVVRIGNVRIVRRVPRRILAHVIHICRRSHV